MTSTPTPNGTPRGRVAFRALPALRERRELGPRPMSLRQLATALEVGFAHLSRVELGHKNATPALADRWAQTLDAARDDLFVRVQTRTDA